MFFFDRLPGHLMRMTHSSGTKQSRCRNRRSTVQAIYTHIYIQRAAKQSKQSAADHLVYLGVGAGIGELPHFAFPVAERTHGNVGLTDLLSAARWEARHLRACLAVWDAVWVADLHERRAVKESQAIKEDYDPNDGGRDEEERVPAEPQVIQGHLLPKIVPSSSRQESKKVQDLL